MRDSRLDLLRVTLILAVLCIHTFCVLDLDIYPQYRTWSLSLNTVCHYAVPLFVMLSGIVLMDRCDGSLPAFYSKRLVRILVPAVPAVLFFVALRVFRDGDSIALVAKESLLGRPYYHLWFAFMLLGVYALMPFLVRLVKEIHNGLLAVVCGIIVYVSWVGGEGPYQIFPYAAYSVLGLMIYRQSMENVMPRFGFAGLAVAIGLTIWNVAIVLKTGSLWTIGYCSPFVLFGSLGLLFFVLNTLPKSLGGNLATRLAALVFGVYLWHPVFKGLAMAAVSCLFPSQMWLVFPIAAIMAFACIWLISRLRIGAILLGVISKRNYSVSSVK